MENKTLDALNTAQTLGGSSLILIAVTFTAFFNGLMLRCFYRVRRQTFVKNSKFLVALVASDFVSTLILIPSIVCWFAVSLPNYTFVCVLKVYPITVINYFRILSMFVFCLYRVFVIHAVTKSGVKHATCKFYVIPVTITLWITSSVAVAMPFILWDQGEIVTECRISFISNVSRARYLAIIFDTPLLGMHIAFMCLLLWSRTYNKVSVVQNESLDLQNRSGINKVSVEPQQHGAQRSGAECVTTQKIIKAGARLTIDSNASFGLTNIRTIDFDIEVHNKQHVTNMTPNMTSVSSTDVNVNTRLDQRKVRFNSTPFTNTQDVRNHGSSGTFPSRHACIPTTSCSGHIEVNNGDVTRRSNDVKSLVVTEIRQFLVTIGIIIVIYDVTILPLLIDFHVAASGSGVLVPQFMNTLWIVNVFTNPIVYLVRMERMRREMKEVLVDTLTCCFPRSGQSTGHSNSVHPA